MMDAKSVLITGGLGFLGQAVTKQLAQKKLYDITVVTSGRHKLTPPLRFTSKP